IPRAWSSPFSVRRRDTLTTSRWASVASPHRVTMPPSSLPGGTAWRKDGSRPRVLGASTAKPSVVADPHRLDVAELADALGEELPAEPGGLDPAERQLRVRGHVAVHEDHPGVE